MTIIDINRTLAEDTIIAAGRAIDRLKNVPPEALAKTRLVDEDGQARHGHEAVRDMALVLYALHDAVRGVARRRTEEGTRDVAGTRP